MRDVVGSELVATFVDWAAAAPEEAAYTVVGADVRETFTRGDIADRVRAKVSTLVSWRRASEGPHAVLLTPPTSVEFITWFWAAQLAGIPVVPAPELSGRFGARAEQIRSVASATPVDEIDRVAMSITDDTPSPVGEDATAVVQFTSGSVSDPKGCVLSHRAVTANMRAATAAFRVGPGQVGVSWCPLYHDMGLFGSVVYPVFAGIHAVLQRPERVVLRPVSWLDELARSGAAISLAPSFALDLVARHLRGKPYERDLSSVKQLIVGSERVHPGSVAAFLEVTTPAGMRPSAIHVAWGMAESTVLCASRPGGVKIERGVQEFPDGVASVGWPAPGVEVRVRAYGREAEDGVIGDVDIRSSGLMSGYWRGAHGVEDPTSDDGWYPTGDAGFLRDGELYIVGRSDDVLISEGRNVYPADAEAVLIEALASARPSVVAVVGIPRPDRAQTIVALVEARKPLDDDDRRAARRACMDLLGLRLDDVVSVGHRSLPRTSSGKLMRSKIRAACSAEGDIVLDLTHYEKVEETDEISDVQLA